VITHIVRPWNGETGIETSSLILRFSCRFRSPHHQEISMPSEPPPTRRLAVALTAAVASTTIAIGVTAASLLGWLRPGAPAAIEATPATPVVAPAAPATPAPPVILVPVTPAAPELPAAAPRAVDGEPAETVQLAVHEREHHHEHESAHERERDEGDGD
jgi:hypothetical protein